MSASVRRGTAATIKAVNSLILVGTLAISAIPAHASVDFTDRLQDIREPMQCFRELLSQSQLAPIDLLVYPVLDQTGISGIEGTPPAESTLVVKHAFAALNDAIRVHGGEEDVQLIPGNRFIQIEAGITAVDINPTDMRKKLSADVGFGKGNGNSYVDLGKDSWQGSFCGAVKLVGYEGKSAYSKPELTAEVGFCAERSQSSSDWGLSVGFLGLGKSTALRVNGDAHAVFAKAFELLIIRVIGRAESLPYWRCTEGIFPVDLMTVDSVRSEIKRLSTETQVKLLEQQLQRHGFALNAVESARSKVASWHCNSKCSPSDADVIAFLYLTAPLAPGDMDARRFVMPQAPDVHWTISGPGPTQSAPAQKTRMMRVYAPQPQYPQRALRNEIEGSVTLRLHVDRNGNVISAEKISSSDRVFLTPALDAVKVWRYSPDNIAPIARTINETIIFKVSN